jgi:hypothetical protein
MMIRPWDISLDYYAVQEKDKRTKETTIIITIITREEKREREIINAPEMPGDRCKRF